MSSYRYFYDPETGLVSSIRSSEYIDLIQTAVDAMKCIGWNEISEAEFEKKLDEMTSDPTK